MHHFLLFAPNEDVARTFAVEIIRNAGVISAVGELRLGRVRRAVAGA